MLYAERGVRVTPSWIGVDDVSHAVRNVVRLRRVRRRRARGAWRALCVTMAALAGLGAAAAARGALPFALAWSAFASALCFALLAAWHGFVAGDVMAVEVGLEDGTSFEAPAADARQLERLHAALARALDWHGGTPVVAPPVPGADAGRAASGAATDAAPNDA